MGAIKRMENLSKLDINRITKNSNIIIKNENILIKAKVECITDYSIMLEDAYSTRIDKNDLSECELKSVISSGIYTVKVPKTRAVIEFQAKLENKSGKVTLGRCVFGNIPIEIARTMVIDIK